MGHLARQVDLALEPLDRHRVGEVLPADRFQRHSLTELLIFGFIDFRSATTGDEANDLVAPSNQIPRLEDRETLEHRSLGIHPQYSRVTMRSKPRRVGATTLSKVSGPSSITEPSRLSDTSPTIA